MILTLFTALFKGMILYMNEKILIVGMALMASVCFIRVCAAEPDKVAFAQDEMKKLLLERDTARHDLDAMAREKEALEDKMRSLNKMVISCDASIRHNAEQAVVPYRSQLQDALEQLKIMTMTLEEKNVHVARVTKENEALSQQAGMLAAEKLSLLQSIRKISGEYDSLTGQVDDQVNDAKASAQEKIKDFQVRLAAEQTLVEEKIGQAKKPLEKKITDMEAACNVRTAEAVQQEKLAQALLQEKIRKVEQQVVLLRENAALEVKKVEDDAASEIKRLKDQLNACPQGSQDPPAAKK